MILSFPGVLPNQRIADHPSAILGSYRTIEHQTSTCHPEANQVVSWLSPYFGIGQWILGLLHNGLPDSNTTHNTNNVHLTSSNYTAARKTPLTSAPLTTRAMGRRRLVEKPMDTFKDRKCESIRTVWNLFNGKPSERGKTSTNE